MGCQGFSLDLGVAHLSARIPLRPPDGTRAAAGLDHQTGYSRRPTPTCSAWDLVDVAPHQCSGLIAHMASMSTMSECGNFVIHECEGPERGPHMQCLRSLVFGMLPGSSDPRQLGRRAIPPA